jgi:hypothetical protein
MIQHDWLTCTDPPTMLKHLTSIGPPKMRKLRSFAIACARCGGRGNSTPESTP